jgi:hypothetical protein
MQKEHIDEDGSKLSQSSACEDAMHLQSAYDWPLGSGTMSIWASYPNV